MVVSVREKELEAVAALDETEIEQPDESQEVDLDRFYTVAEYMTLPDDGKKYELVEGKLIEMPGPGLPHGEIIRQLGEYLRTFVRLHKLGSVSTDVTFVLDPVNAPNTVRLPDIAFLIKARRETYDGEGAFSGPPDLAVEVVSPLDKWSEVVAKVAEYQAAKVPLVWVVEQWTRTVQVYRLENGLLYQVVWPDAELDGGIVLPGFKLKVSNIFAN